MNNELGNIGELQACLFLVRNGWYPYVGFGGKGPADVLAVKDGVVLRCECKATSSIQPKTGAIRIKLNSIRHNKTSTISHKFDATKSDVCFVWLEPVHVLLVRDSSTIHGRTEWHVQPSNLPRTVESKWFPGE